MGASPQKFSKMFIISILGSVDSIYSHNSGVCTLLTQGHCHLESPDSAPKSPAPKCPFPLEHAWMGAPTLTPRGTFMHLVGFMTRG